LNLSWTLCFVLNAAVRGGSDDTCLIKLCLGITRGHVTELILNRRDMVPSELIGTPHLIFENLCFLFLLTVFLTSNIEKFSEDDEQTCVASYTT